MLPNITGYPSDNQGFLVWWVKSTQEYSTKFEFEDTSVNSCSTNPIQVGSDTIADSLL
jgi:hypothetical protein